MVLQEKLAHSPTLSSPGHSLPGAPVAGQSTVWFSPSPGRRSNPCAVARIWFCVLIANTTCSFQGVCGDGGQFVLLPHLQVSVQTSVPKCFGDYIKFPTYSGLGLKRASCPWSTRYDFTQKCVIKSPRSSWTLT